MTITQSSSEKSFQFLNRYHQKRKFRGATATATSFNSSIGIIKRYRSYWCARKRMVFQFLNRYHQKAFDIAHLLMTAGFQFLNRYHQKFFWASQPVNAPSFNSSIGIIKRRAHAVNAQCPACFNSSIGIIKSESAVWTRKIKEVSIPQ